MTYNREYQRRYYEAHKDDEEYKRKHAELQRCYWDRLKQLRPEKYEEIKARQREYQRKRIEAIKADPIKYEEFKAKRRKYDKRYIERKKQMNETKKEADKLLDKLISII